jgi:DNA-binding Lrp family transcriptional regulator
MMDEPPTVTLEKGLVYPKGPLGKGLRRSLILGIKALIDSGVIRRFTIKVGLTEGAEAMALLSINPSFPTSDVSKLLKKFHNVETVYEITGQYDIAAIISGLKRMY